MNTGSIYTTSNINTPAILNPSTGDTVLSANDARIGFRITNIGINKIYLKLGTGATTSVFHTILSGCTTVEDGTGGYYDMTDGAVYLGAVSVAGTTPRLVVVELAP